MSPYVPAPLPTEVHSVLLKTVTLNDFANIIPIMTTVLATRKKMMSFLYFFGFRFRFSGVNNTVPPSFNDIDLFKASSS